MKTMGIIRLGIQVPSFSFGAGRSGANASGKALSADAGIFENLVDVATVAEAAGFDSFFLMDHYRQIPMVGAPVDPMPEAYTVLGGIAGRTSTIMLGTLVSGVTYRNPAVLAKMVTTLDVVSSGRAILGIGAAWLDTEHDSYGIEFPPVSERMDRLEEAVQICRMMFDEEAPSFQGRYYTIKDAFNFPRPLQAGGPPILVGGGGERRTLQIVAMHADACNVFGVGVGVGGVEAGVGEIGVHDDALSRLRQPLHLLGSIVHKTVCIHCTLFPKEAQIPIGYIVVIKPLHCLHDALAMKPFEYKPMGDDADTHTLPAQAAQRLRCPGNRVHRRKQVALGKSKSMQALVIVLAFPDTPLRDTRTIH